jgi:hypothetical protein
MKRLLLTAALTLGVTTDASGQSSDILVDGAVVGTIESLGISQSPNSNILERLNNVFGCANVVA